MRVWLKPFKLKVAISSAGFFIAPSPFPTMSFSLVGRCGGWWVLLAVAMARVGLGALIERVAGPPAIRLYCELGTTPIVFLMLVAVRPWVWCIWPWRSSGIYFRHPHHFLRGPSELLRGESMSCISARLRVLLGGRQRFQYFVDAFGSSPRGSLRLQAGISSMLCSTLGCLLICCGDKRVFAICRQRSAWGSPYYAAMLGVCMF